MDKGTWLLIIGTVLSFAAGLLVTVVDFSKGVELVIFPGLPMLAIAGLIYLGKKEKEKSS